MISVSLSKKKGKKKGSKKKENAFGEVKVDQKDKVELTHYSREEELEQERKAKRRKVVIDEEVVLEKDPERLVPERVTEEEYEEMPVEEFGAAMLRGMGWDDEAEEEEEKDTKLQKKKKMPHELLHPEGLGLGAKNTGTNDKASVKELIENFMPVKKVPKK